MNSIDNVIQSLYNQDAVILPTETVYGIASLYDQAILYKLKQRPSTMPISIAYPSIDHVIDNTNTDEYQRMCIKALLPGPFTLLLHSKCNIVVGIRVPDHGICIDVLKKINNGVFMTSANLHGANPSVKFHEAQNFFPGLIGINGGRCKYARPSMIIDLTQTR